VNKKKAKVFIQSADNVFRREKQMYKIVESLSKIKFECSMDDLEDNYSVEVIQFAVHSTTTHTHYFALVKLTSK